MAEVALAAELRASQGSANSRRLRAAGKIPGVVYGHGTEPMAVSVDARSLRLALNTEAGLNALLNLEVDGKKHLTLARSLQKHPVRGTVAHVDFIVVNRNEQVNADVPINFVGEADKVNKGGGVLEHLVNSLAIQATPATVPSHIEIDISDLEIDDAIRVKDVKLPKGVTTSMDPEEPIVIAAITRAEVSEEAGEGAEGEGDVAGGGEGAASAPAES